MLRISLRSSDDKLMSKLYHVSSLGVRNPKVFLMAGTMSDFRTLALTIDPAATARMIALLA